MLKLQNGSDIRGVVLENDDQEVNLTLSRCYKIGNGFALWLKKTLQKEDLKIAIGYDSRITAKNLQRELTKAFLEQGIEVIDTGLATTPAMFMATLFEEFGADGAVMITASHLPYNYNGFKFFTKSGGLNSPDIKEILQTAQNFLEEVEVEMPIQKGRIIKKEILPVYAEHMREKIIGFANNKENPLKPLSGFKILVNAGNGAGGFFATEVLKPLGAEIEGSLFLDPDGTFPNHMPNPENEIAVQKTVEAMKESKADLGIIFDTDVDRAGLVGYGGEVIIRNDLIALVSAILLEEQDGAMIVTDSVTSDGLFEFIKARGGKHHRFKRGYRNVINEAVRLNESGVFAPLAIETSGHAALKENFFLDDGAYVVARIIGKMPKLHEEGKRLSSLIEGLKRPLEEEEMRIVINADDFSTYGNQILLDMESFLEEMVGCYKAKTNYEGIRVNCIGDAEGWFLMRMSLHEPLLVINFESSKIGGIDKIKEMLFSFLKRYDKLKLNTNIKNSSNF